MKAMADALADVVDLVVEAAHERRAHRARRLPLRAEHVAVHDERVVATEEVGKGHVAATFGDEPVLARHLAARREGAPHLRDPLRVPAELDLLDQQLLACPPVLGGLVRMAMRRSRSQFGGGDERGRVGGHVDADVATCRESSRSRRIDLPPTRGASVGMRRRPDTIAGRASRARTGGDRRDHGASTSRTRTATDSSRSGRARARMSTPWSMGVTRSSTGSSATGRPTLARRRASSSPARSSGGSTTTTTGRGSGPTRSTSATTSSPPPGDTGTRLGRSGS